MNDSTRLIAKLKRAGYEPKSYSGRGMFGKRCVSVGNVAPWELAQAFRGIPEPLQDQLGKGLVLYWPMMEWPK